MYLHICKKFIYLDIHKKNLHFVHILFINFLVKLSDFLHCFSWQINNISIMEGRLYGGDLK